MGPNVNRRVLWVLRVGAEDGVARVEGRCLQLFPAWRSYDFSGVCGVGLCFSYRIVEAHIFNIGNNGLMLHWSRLSLVLSNELRELCQRFRIRLFFLILGRISSEIVGDWNREGLTWEALSTAEVILSMRRGTTVSKISGVWSLHVWILDSSRNECRRRQSVVTRLWGEMSRTRSNYITTGSWSEDKVEKLEMKMWWGMSRSRSYLGCLSWGSDCPGSRWVYVLKVLWLYALFCPIADHHPLVDVMISGDCTLMWLNGRRS